MSINYHYLFVKNGIKIPPLRRGGENYYIYDDTESK